MGHAPFEIRNRNKRTGLESHNALGVGERYHSYRRRIFDKVRADAPNIKKILTLFITVRICNDTAKIDVLSPTLLVFEIVSRLPI